MKPPTKRVFLAFALLACAYPAQARDRPDPQQPPSRLPERPNPGRLQFEARGPSSARVALAEDMDVGIGLYSVSGHFVRDRGARGREPIVGPRGSDNRVAAVGFSLRF